jgi:hypothetical protein
VIIALAKEKLIQSIDHNPAKRIRDRRRDIAFMFRRLRDLPAKGGHYVTDFVQLLCAQLTQFLACTILEVRVADRAGNVRQGEGKIRVRYFSRYR